MRCYSRRSRLTAILAAAFLSAGGSATPAAAQTIEALRLTADAALIKALPLAVHPDIAEPPQEPVLKKPLDPTPPSTAPGPVVARVALAGLFSANRHILTRTLGARPLDIGTASDAAFKQQFFTFSDPKTTTLAPIGDANRLRGPGVDARVDANTVYNFKIEVNLFSPVRGSTLKMTPTQGTRGPTHAVKTGAILDATRARSFVFRAHDQELWLFYDADVLPDGSGFAETRSFLFTKEAGLSSKSWPLAESKLVIDAAADVDLDGLRLNLTRTSAGELVIRESR